MNDFLLFTSRDEFRNWLHDNCLSSSGVWLLFAKSGVPKTIKAYEALEQALCFGWIDGKMTQICLYKFSSNASICQKDIYTGIF